MTTRPAIPADVQRQIFVEAGHRCAVCGTPVPLERAHIVPWAASKDHSADNLICLCANCHERADKENWGAKTLREYKRKPWVHRNHDPATKPEFEDPIIGELFVSAPYGYTMSGRFEATSETFRVLSQPCSTKRGIPNEHGQDITCDFDLTNPNEMDLRIASIKVAVQEYHSITAVKTDPICAGGQIRRYFCDVRGRLGDYDAKPLSNEYDYIRLSHGELERFALSVNTRDRGVYKLGVFVEYSVGKRTGKTETHEFSRLVGFY